MTVVGLVEQGGAVVGQRLRHRAHPGRDRGPVVGRLGRHQVEGAADPVHGAVDDVDPRLGLVRLAQRELGVGPLEERALRHPLAVVGRRRPLHLGAGPAQQLLARGVAVGREVGQPVLVAGDAGERRHDRVGRSHVDHEALGDVVGLAGGCGRRVLGHGPNLSPRCDSHRPAEWAGHVRSSSSRSPIRPSCRSASGATDIAAAIRDHQVVVLAGETGSGKTTQLPKICLELGRGRGAGRGGIIGHTQPRRIAARSVAERIADELGTELGDLVGYQVRFTDRTSKRSRVKLMTDGILLAELQRDRDLRRYDTIIIDEAHERSLNIDFLLGYLKRLLPRRPDLKLIITSATIDVDRFAEHFDAPVVEVSGRTYPVEVRYRPAGGAARRPTRRASRSSATRPRRSWTRCASSAPRGRATSWCSCPASGRSATPPTRSPTPPTRPRSCRSTRGSRRPSSTRCSRRTPGAASCSPPTSPRRR